MCKTTKTTVPVTEKECTSCNKTLSLDKFGPFATAKDGLMYKCRKCHNASCKAYRKTKGGLIRKIYHNQRQTAIKRDMPLPTYNVNTFKAWIEAQPNFDTLYTAWKASGYDMMKIPSVDRLDDYVSYKFSNIQLMTWEENKAKGCKDTREGRLNKRSYHVAKLDRDTKKEIERYHSMAEAGRQNGIAPGNISLVCRGIRPTVGGFAWEAIEKLY